MTKLRRRRLRSRCFRSRRLSALCWDCRTAKFQFRLRFRTPPNHRRPAPVSTVLTSRGITSSTTSRFHLVVTPAPPRTGKTRFHLVVIPAPRTGKRVSTWSSYRRHRKLEKRISTWSHRRHHELEKRRKKPAPRID